MGIDYFSTNKSMGNYCSEIINDKIKKDTNSKKKEKLHYYNSQKIAQTPSQYEKKRENKENSSNIEENQIHYIKPIEAKDIRISIVGKCSVGKTRYYKRITRENYVDKPSSSSGNNTCRFFETDAGKLRAIIWDTAGQEDYKNITKKMILKADGIILMYCIDDIESFERLKSFWIPIIEANSPHLIKVLLVGNKMDLDKKDQRKVSFQEGKALAEMRNWLFWETSAEYNTNVEESMKNMVDVLARTKDWTKKEYTSGINTRKNTKQII